MDDQNKNMYCFFLYLMMFFFNRIGMERIRVVGPELGLLLD